MKQETFINNDGRDITIEINKEQDVINFYHDKGKAWFYDISLQEWKKKYPYWQDQLKDKIWFTDSMATFINLNT